MLRLEQLESQFKKQYNISTITDTDIKMETSDLSYQATPASTTTSAPERISDELKSLHEIIDILSIGIRTCNDELIRLNDESVQQSQLLETVDQLLPTVKTSTEESNNALSAMSTNLMILQQGISLLQQKYDDNQVTSYDGTLVWKIPRFQEKMGKNIR
jgi:chromosome segregation ATPase